MRRATLLLCTLLVCPLSVDAAGADTSNSRIRLVLITLDTLRRDHFSANEATHSRMPRVFARAKAGIRFSRLFVTSSTTQPSHASMFTGLYPWEHGVTRNGQVLGQDSPSLVPILRQAGFETRAIVASFPLSRRFGFERGFDHFTDEFTSTVGKKGRWEKQWEVPDNRFFSDGGFITDKALESLDAATAAKQFFWFHYFDAHAPYGSSLGHDLKLKDILDPERRGAESEEAAVQRARDYYRADVGFLDVQLDRLLQRLADDSRDIPTHIFVLADHGESFGEAGAFGHGQLTHEQLLVPAFLLSPEAAPAVREGTASGVDVARTLLSLAGLPKPDAGIGGRDLLAPSPDPTRAFGMRRSYRSGKGRARLLGGASRELTGELFFVAEPDGQFRRGSASHVLPEDAAGLGPSQISDLQQLFGSFEAAMNEAPSTNGIDPAVRRALEALGYVE